VEVIRQALLDDGIPVSSRDVFIRGIPIEFDLIVPRHDASPPADRILYEATLSLQLQLNTICAAWHITTSGCYSFAKGCDHEQDIGQL